MDIELAVMLSGAVLAVISYFITKKHWLSTLIVGSAFVIAAVLSYIENKDTFVTTAILACGLLQTVRAYILRRKNR